MKTTVRAVLILNEGSEIFGVVKIIVRHGKPTHHSLNIQLETKYWNHEDEHIKKTHPNHITLNRIIQNKKSEITDFINKLRADGEKITLFRIKKFLQGESEDDDFIKYVENVLKLRRNQARTAKNPKGKYSMSSVNGWDSCFTKLKQYKRHILFSEINVSWLIKYEAWLRGEQKNKSVIYHLSNNTVHRHWKFIRNMILSALAEDLISENPFKRFKDAPTYKQEKVTWHPIEIADKMEALLSKPITQTQKDVINFFLLSWYSGLRLSDLLRYNRGFIQNGELVLRAKKNGQWVTHPMHQRLKATIERIGDRTLDYSEKTIRDNLETIGKMLGVERMNPHSARHSYAVWGLEKGLKPIAIAELMGISLRTFLQHYANVTSRNIRNEVSKFDE